MSYYANNSIQNIKFNYYLDTEPGKFLAPRRRQRKQFVFGTCGLHCFFPEILFNDVLGLSGLEIFEEGDAMGFWTSFLLVVVVVLLVRNLVNKSSSRKLLSWVFSILISTIGTGAAGVGNGHTVSVIWVALSSESSSV